MRVLFLGNHTVGVVALKALIEKAEVVGVVAHPEDDEDGVRYESVFDFATKMGIPVIRGKGKETFVKNFIVAKEPDLIWVTDYRYLLPESLLSVPNMGGINLHPSLLPKYRGRAPVNWAIINGEKEIGLTAHYLTPGVDNGDVIEQQSCIIDDNEDVGDALERLMPIYHSVTVEVIQRLVEGNVTSYPQNEAEATIYKARTPEDGEIDWGISASKVRNLIRAVSTPYPGAYSMLDGDKVYIWKAEALDIAFYSGKVQVGKVLEVADSEFIVCCMDKPLKVINYTFEKGIKKPINAGMVFS